MVNQSGFFGEGPIPYFSINGLPHALNDLTGDLPGNILDCLLPEPRFKSQSIPVKYQMCIPCTVMAQIQQTLS